MRQHLLSYLWQHALLRDKLYFLALQAAICHDITEDHTPSFTPCQGTRIWLQAAQWEVQLSPQPYLCCICLLALLLCSLQQWQVSYMPWQVCATAVYKCRTHSHVVLGQVLCQPSCRPRLFGMQQHSTCPDVNINGFMAALVLLSLPLACCSHKCVRSADAC